MFIVKKEIKGRDYYYLRQSIREGGKVKAKTIAYLGKTRKEAEKKKKEIIANLNQDNKINKPKEKPVIMEEKKEMKPLTIDEMANFCKRKGFIYPSAELYGGLAGFWDYGPIGSELKNNLKTQWWKHHVHCREDVVGIDGSIITNPKVWEASGHVENFTDIAVVCKKCKNKFKVDEQELATAKCDKCGSDVESKGKFVPMFTTQVGPIEEDSTLAYLRPETAQLIFTNFKLVQDNARLKLPFGIAQIGKAFRNEIAPRNFIFRVRELEQMEIEYFIDPEKKEECPYEIEDIEIKLFSEEMQEKNEEPVPMKIKTALKEKIIQLPWHAYWLSSSLNWFKSLGANMENFRIRQHTKDEKSHYSTDTWDLEYNFPFGWKELQGIADRGTYDLSAHQEKSKKSMEIMDDASGRKILPMVVAEPSFGVERAFLVFMNEAYTVGEKDNVILKLNPKLAPIKVAIFPLVKKDEALVKISKEIYKNLREEWNVLYDDSGSVGRRYARNDEIGTPFCITVDSDSIKQKDVTIRNRDDGKQVRIKIPELKDTLRKLISGEIEFEDLK
ncbi:glycine--tRNA ligase [archaeon]|jgi:glycyl-tRNA synthetase|nr:glycine--tRNA ligase [archaeon]MBT3577686.1 glycine--tRNA ligase [archaeon]MBT6820047.1 glycine--tRNA ligase [archaeon]MBT6956340.1 glycine--tRNA ligase [archaeon]MBT7025352.1 glycine--tRNA ligase [archaeon]